MSSTAKQELHLRVSAWRFRAHKGSQMSQQDDRYVATGLPVAAVTVCFTLCLIKHKQWRRTNEHSIQQHYEVVSSQAKLHPVKIATCSRRKTHWNGDWVVPRVVLDDTVKIIIPSSVCIEARSSTPYPRPGLVNLSEGACPTIDNFRRYSFAWA
jgi:hypothetical protein